MKLSPLTRLLLVSTALGVDLEDVTRRAFGPCICGQLREKHDKQEPFACSESGCEGFVAPPPKVDVR